MKSGKKDHYYKVVVVGGGFGGVKAALQLAKDRRCNVTLVSDKDTLLHHPSLHATATGAPRKTPSLPLSKIFARSQVSVYQDTVVGIDTSRKIIVGTAGQYEYDAAVFALGVVTNHFGIQGLGRRSWDVTTEDGVQAFRRRIHDELMTMKHYKKQYAVIGAGPKGVELAASLQDYILRVGKHHNLKQHNVSIALIEAAPRVLPRMSPSVSRAALKRLTALGVTVVLGTVAKRLDDETLVAGEKTIPMQAVLWTAGVSNHPFYESHDTVFHVNKRGAVLVNEHLEAAPNVFVIGDSAATKYAGLARTALHHGAYAAKVIRKRLSGIRHTPYMPKRPFSIVPVGHKWAVLERGRIHLHGFNAAAMRKLADFAGYYAILPFGTAASIWLREREAAEFGCELCQKNNDSSRVAPSS